MNLEAVEREIKERCESSGCESSVCESSRCEREGKLLETISVRGDWNSDLYIRWKIDFGIFVVKAEEKI